MRRGQSASPKQRDHFDASRGPELLRLGTRLEPTVPRSKPAPAEDLITNLVPILKHGDRIWSAPTRCRGHDDVHRIYETVEEHRASDYLICDKQLYSLRAPLTCSLRHVCDADQAASQPVTVWSESGDSRLRRYWVELLRHTLLQQTKGWLQWHPAREVFFIPVRRWKRNVFKD